MVLGYPGVTFRALLAEEMAERQARSYPRVIDVYGELIRIMEEEGAKDPAGKIAVASHLKGLHNRYKNSAGSWRASSAGASWRSSARPRPRWPPGRRSARSTRAR
jgi:hypothetical protein